MKFKVSHDGFIDLDEEGVWYPSTHPLALKWLEKGNTPEPEFTEEELAARELNEKISTANQYLAQTDWVNAYKIRHDLGLELIPETSSKWAIISKREEYIEFLKGI